MNADTATFWNLLVPSTINLGLFVTVLTLGLRDYDQFRANWRTGLAIGFGLFLLQMPVRIFVLTHVDVQAALERAHMAANNAPVVTSIIYVGLTIGFTISVIAIFWYMLVYHAAADQWRQIREDPFPLLQRRGRRPWRAIAGAAAFGMAAGAISAFVFKRLGVDVSDAVRRFQELTPSAAQASLYVRLPMLVLAVVAAALAEELLYRGVLLGWLLRVARGRVAGIVLATVVVSLLWAALHYQNTNAPWIKCGQIFVIGVFLCEFARRSCLEASIAAHVGLNVAGLLIALAIH